MMCAHQHRSTGDLPCNPPLTRHTCLLVSGAGRYPWLAVAGIYAIPVAWNCIIILPGVVPVGCIALSVVAAFAYVYLVVIRKIRYNRLMGGLE